MNNFVPPSRIPATPLSKRDLPRPAASNDMPRRRLPLMRRYDVHFLNDNNQAETRQHTAPASRLFEKAFSAFARGTLIQTTNGPMAIEDIWPGDKIVTQEFGPLSALWIGSMSIIPDAPVDRPENAQMTRVMADTFGMGRPMSDLLVGPGARLLHRPTALRELPGGGLVYSPARDFADGDSVIQITPQRPVKVFHICLARHATIQAAGLDAESYHPGKDVAKTTGPNMLQLFLSLFPHVEQIEDFGPMAHPRGSVAALNSLSAA